MPIPYRNTVQRERSKGSMSDVWIEKRVWSCFCLIDHEEKAEQVAADKTGKADALRENTRAFIHSDLLHLLFQTRKIILKKNPYETKSETQTYAKVLA